MSSWRERLCGSIAFSNKNEEGGASLKQFISPNESISCGGGFYPTAKNVANVQTISSSVVLPTDQYSVLMFRQDGTAVIYSDAEPVAAAEERESEDRLSVSKM